MSIDRNANVWNEFNKLFEYAMRYVAQGHAKGKVVITVE